MLTATMLYVGQVTEWLEKAKVCSHATADFAYTLLLYKLLYLSIPIYIGDRDKIIRIF